MSRVAVCVDLMVWSFGNMTVKGLVVKVLLKHGEYDRRKFPLQPESTRAVSFDRLLPLPHPPVRARTSARTNPSAQRVTQLSSVLARVYAISMQNQITTTVP
jgi:hypothetical protein